MKRDKIINLLAVLGITLACVFTFLLAYRTDIFSIQKSSGSTKYATSVFDKDSIMKVNIIMSDADWNDMLENAAKEEYYSCDLEVNGTLYKNVGIRPKGNTSLSQIVSDDTTDRYSFKLEFDHYDSSQTLDGLDKLCLNNIMSDATYMKEYLSYDIMSYMGVKSSLYEFASISRNGENWGLYLAIEGVEDSFVERNYGAEKVNLYKPDNGMGGAGKDDGKMEMPENMDEMPDGQNMPDKGELPDGQDMPDNTGQAGAQSNADGNVKENQNPEQNSDFQQEMQDKMKDGGGMGSTLEYTDDDLDSYSVIWDSAVFNITKSDKEKVVTALKNITNQTDIDDYLDVDQMLRYMAASVVILNDDSYFGNMCHNYYLSEIDGKLCMLPWDYNLSFGGFAGGNATDLVNRAIDTVTSSGSLEDRPMLAAALSSDENKNKYHEYLADLVSGYFNSGVFEQTVKKVQKMIASYVKNDPTAFYTYDEFNDGVDTLLDFVSLRFESIEKQLNGTIPASADDRTGSEYTLVDASDITISTMGTQGGGQGGPDGGQNGQGGQDFEKGQGFQGRDENQNTDSRMNAAGAGQGQPPPQMNQNEEQTDTEDAKNQQHDMQQMQGGKGFDMKNINGRQPESGKIDKKSVAYAAGMIVLMLLAVSALKVFNRRKYRSK